MAESLKKLKELFDLKDADLRTYSPLTLAYIGDGVYELVIRTILVKKANCPVNRLHKKASSLVKASAQSGMMEILEPLLTEEEKSVYRRGRNAHSATMAKHQPEDRTFSTAGSADDGHKLPILDFKRQMVNDRKILYRILETHVVKCKHIYRLISHAISQNAAS